MARKRRKKSKSTPSSAKPSDVQVGDIVRKGRSGILFEVVDILRGNKPIGVKVRPLDSPEDGESVMELPELQIVDPLDALGAQTDW